MTSRRAPSIAEGWILVGWTGLAIAGVVGALFGIHGAGLDTVQRGLQATARMSVVLFALAFAASTLRRLWPAPPTAWLLRNRRYVGVSFALSHFVHLGLIASLVHYTPERFAAPQELVPGAIAYAFLAAMTVTSFDGPAARLGKRRWKRLHLAGSWWIWFVFTAKYSSYIPRSFAYAAIAGALWAIAALRVIVWLRDRRRKAARAT